MAKQENNIPKPDLLARKEIPDAWAQSGHCPACQAASLQVVHLSNATDYLICAKCELSFEVALNGGKIRIKNVPDQLGFMEQELRYHWVEASALTYFFSNRLVIHIHHCNIVIVQIAYISFAVIDKQQVTGRIKTGYCSLGLKSCGIYYFNFL